MRVDVVRVDVVELTCDVNKDAKVNVNKTTPARQPQLGGNATE